MLTTWAIRAMRAALRWAPRRLVRHASAVAELDHWVRAHPTRHHATRRDLYAAVHTSLGGGRLDYLEFGVARGVSLRAWLALDDHPDSRFFGFDSFEGLPEDWDASPRRVRRRGAFTQGGEPPTIDDPRVQFVKGWFQDTLPGFLATTTLRPPVVVHHDGDLYSSALYGLTMLDGVLAPGSVLIFDEFNRAAHEFRAFMDYLAAYRRGYAVLGATARYEQVAIGLGDPMPFGSEETSAP